MSKNHPETWVLVADKCQAKIFRIVKFPKIEEISHLEHPASGLLNQDLISSKPGRSFQSTGTARSAYQSETEPKQVEAIKFATEIAQMLYKASNNGEFDSLYIVANPSFLGLLRQHINPQIQKHIVAEIHKELTSSNTEAIEQHLADLKN
ncbi:MAG TPA: host attachment protein [Parachlamydiaceae bacterium]|nr:host attachment protein [Parachlamydiaceae bacterium]